MTEETYNKWLVRLFMSLMAFVLMMGLRNAWLLGARVSVLFDAPRIEYKRLWSYNKMMVHFWVWDVEKMKYTGRMIKS